jgi:hypothetical protein
MSSQKYLKYLNPDFRSQKSGEKQTTVPVFVIEAFILDSGS